MADEQDYSPFAGLDRANRAIAGIGGALAELGEDRRWLIPWIAEGMADRSIAAEILAFATGPTAGCSSGGACARLYLALQGYPIDLRDTNTAFDLTRQQWWLTAMFERLTGRWGGSQKGVKVIAAAHPTVWEQAEAVMRAWERTEAEQKARFRSPYNEDGTGT
jgi:hypothetical protein